MLTNCVPYKFPQIKIQTKEGLHMSPCPLEKREQVTCDLNHNSLRKGKGCCWKTELEISLFFFFFISLWVGNNVFHERLASDKLCLSMVVPFVGVEFYFIRYYVLWPISFHSTNDYQLTSVANSVRLSVEKRVLSKTKTVPVIRKAWPSIAELRYVV